MSQLQRHEPQTSSGPAVRARYADARDLTLRRLAEG